MALLVYVDDVMVAGRRSYIMDFFIPLIKNRFEISSDFPHPLWYKDDCIIVCHIGVLQVQVELLPTCTFVRKSPRRTRALYVTYWNQ